MGIGKGNRGAAATRGNLRRHFLELEVAANFFDDLFDGIVRVYCDGIERFFHGFELAGEKIWVGKMAVALQQAGLDDIGVGFKVDELHDVVFGIETGC